MPCAAWTAAASPELFERAARHARATEQRAARARNLAERLGTAVVPHPRLSDADRRAVLALRRRLHAGAAPGAADFELLDRSSAVPSDLAGETRALARETESAAAE